VTFLQNKILIIFTIITPTQSLLDLKVLYGMVHTWVGGPMISTEPHLRTHCFGSIIPIPIGMVTWHAANPNQHSGIPERKN
jgi:hypothetical protein